VCHGEEREEWALKREREAGRKTRVSCSSSSLSFVLVCVCLCDDVWCVEGGGSRKRTSLCFRRLLVVYFLSMDPRSRTDSPERER